jgi:hypothetical protein
MSKNSVKNLPDGWEIRVAESRDEIEAIRPIWERMQSLQNYPTIDADIDRHLSVVESMEGKAQPCIIVLSYEGKPSVMVIARIQEHELVITLGYKKLFRPRLKCLVVSYGGILGQINSDTGCFVIRELMKQLRSRKIDMVYFSELRTDSLIFDFSRKLPGFLCRDHTPVVDTHWQTTALSSREEFTKTLSRNERRNITRHTKQLENKASGIVELKSYRGLDEMNQYISVASEISSLTYQKMITGGFSDSPSTRSLLTEAVKKDWFRAYILYAGSEPVAFESGLLYKSTYFAEYRGFHPDWTCGSPGSILLLKVLEEFSQDTNIQKYDYGFGDAPYKQRYGQEKWMEAPIYIFAPGLYPIFVNIIRTLIASFEISVKYILKKYGFIDRVKRSWRKRLEEKALRKEKNSEIP